MTDNSATAVYKGTGISTANWQSTAERRNADADQVDMTDDCDHDFRLSGRDGEAYGDHVGSAPGNLSIQHVSNPAKTRGLPSDHRTSQNQLARPRGRR